MRAYISIARIDHWFKNVFCIPGIALAYSFTQRPPAWHDLLTIATGLLAVCLMASANYTLNEWLDKRSDLNHPEKHTRAAARGSVRSPWVYLQYFGLAAAALALGWYVGLPFTYALLCLWVMGLIYNVPPVRSKDLAYVDALSESINNPIRLALGWWMVDDIYWPPLTALASYWMLGAYFMTLKRYAELSHIGDPERAARYRSSFRHTTPVRLLVAAVFFSNGCCILAGVFLGKYRVELVLAFPFLAALLAVYLRVALRANSPVQHPERLYAERALMGVATLTLAVTLGLLFVDLPFLRDWLAMQAPAEVIKLRQ